MDIADFACLQSRLVIELDGSQHRRQTLYDERRTTFVEAQDFRVLRFWNGHVFDELEAVIETIACAVLNPEWRQERDPLLGTHPP